jgi:hypothetical protein
MEPDNEITSPETHVEEEEIENLTEEGMGSIDAESETEYDVINQNERLENANETETDGSRSQFTYISMLLPCSLSLILLSRAVCRDF